MCGIAGILSKQHEPLEPLVNRMLSQIVHRGPDETGIYFDNELALGTVRLAIIDVASGQQPLAIGNRFVLGFNGAVYNYVELQQELKQLGYSFATNSDTEVVFHSLVEWGTEAFHRFDGHFAIAFYDRRDKELLLARDPFGEKPLFYTTQSGRLAFASEIKAFRALPFFEFELDPTGLSQIAWLWTTLPNQTCFKNVASVRPGHFLRYRADSIHEHRYYTLPPQTANESITPQEAREELARLMNQSVSRRLRSDLEVASYLSGGLDSTIVSCLAHETIKDRLKTFSVSFETAGFDESAAQQQVASYLGTEHHALRISFTDIERNFRDVVRHTETALFRTAPVPMFMLSRFVRENGICVVLTGEGADEFFTGYDLFKATLFRQRFLEFESDEERASYLIGLYPYLPHFNQEAAQKLVRFFSNYTDPDLPFFSHAMRFANGRLASQVNGNHHSLDDLSRPLQNEMNSLVGGEFSQLDRISQAQALELGTLLTGYLLSSQGDRMTSANSVEGRCPFLSTELIEFAQSLPPNFKLDENGVEKKILRDTFRTQIPAEITKRRKQPYRAPDAAPFLGNPEYVDGLIGEDLLPGTTAIDRQLAARLIQKLRRNGLAQISPREDQAFVFMLSTLILEREYCQSQASRITGSLSLKTRIDGRPDADKTRKSA